MGCTLLASFSPTLNYGFTEDGSFLFKKHSKRVTTFTVVLQYGHDV